MKTGLGVYRKYRMLFAYLNLFRFWLRKKFLWFDVANQFIQRVDKISMQLILKNNGAKIGENCDIETGLTFHNCKNYSNLIIGNNCHIGKNCFFDLMDKVTICNNVVVSMCCTFITHIDMTKSNLSQLFPQEQKEIIVNKNCYIAAETTILMGVELAENVFVASNCLVNKNIKTKTMVGGVPVTEIKQIN